MKTIHYSTLLLALYLGGVSTLPAQVFNSGSNGTNGALIVAASGSTNIVLPPDGVLNYTTVNIGNNASVTFTRNALNTPVYLLAQSNIFINGTINLSGGTRPAAIPSNPGSEGPGGFVGGFGPVQGYPASDGQGPGGGKASASTRGGVFAFPKAGNSNVYGNTLLVPLVGGSGGAGGTEGGGGGGGAILVASSTRITLIFNNFNQIVCAGGSGAGAAGGGSGGAIRLVAPIVDGNGYLQAAGAGADNQAHFGSDGRIRIDTLDRLAWRNLTFNAAKWTVGSQMYVFPLGNPRLDIVEAAGQVIPEGTNAPVNVSLLPGSSTNQVIKVKATGFSGNVPVTVAVVPEAGPSTRFDSDILVSGTNPVVANINVVIPVDSFCNIKVWTR